MMAKLRCRAVLSIVLLFCLSINLSFAQAAAPATEGLTDILDYIERGWTVLGRSLDNCNVVADRHPELHHGSVMYLPKDMPIPANVAELQKKCNLKVEFLPVKVTRAGTPEVLSLPPGLLYLPNRYVVPGGMFNEMYGWDSYFILVGLVRAGKVDVAKGMVENFFFEIENYGTILNANRTYFLTRSQPPFLSSMVLSVYDANKDRAWLQRAYSFIARDYEFWMREPHLDPVTGLSRYYDFGEGPVPEVAEGHDPYYRDVFTSFAQRKAEIDKWGYVNWSKPGESDNTASTWGPKSPLYNTSSCEQDFKDKKEYCTYKEVGTLTADYYRGDRSMRESGFDISDRFGPYSGSTHHFAAVCLNSLLYKAEADLENIARILGRNDEAKKWRAAAEKRKQRMNQYFWDAKAGMFFDYNIQKKQRSDYQYITTYYPLWAGLATPEQAKALRANLHIFDEPGGLLMSPYYTGVQWDYPYGWAPNNLLAIEGLRRYKFDDDANRLSVAWLGTIVENFRRDGTIREKYNVVTRSSESKVRVGYQENMVGFGWTNGVFLELLQALPVSERAKIAAPQAKAVGTN